MDNKFLAKTNPRETIAEHTYCLLERLEVLKKLYPDIPHVDWEILKLACAYHDLGKMNSKFQNKLLKNLGEELQEDTLPNRNEIPHGYLSPAFLPYKELKKKYKKDKSKIKILCQSIYYHHNREKIEDFEKIEEVIEHDLKTQWKLFDELDIDKVDKLSKGYLKYVDSTNRFSRSDSGDNKSYYEYIMTKGLLNRLDYAASAHIDVEEENNGLLEKTIYSIEKNGFELNDLQKYMLENLDENNIIRASTGIGKTEAALVWIGNNKGFFTLPLKVSINAIYDRVRDLNKIGFKNTGLLHSDTFKEYIKRQEKNGIDMNYYDKTKQFSMPLTVCTLDQILDFVFKCEGYELKLATLAYSRVVIDEIQMYSPELLGYLIAGLKYISELGGKFTILTATLPSVVLDFMREEGIEFKESKSFCKKNAFGKSQLRHRVKVFNEQLNTELIEQNYVGKKTLVIVNTVKKAQSIFDKLKELNLEEDVYMFHSRYIKRDRSKKESEILDMGQRECKETGIWITTQVVEASLDIDFDVLYTELSEISGLLQRMGRVYRGRDLDHDDPNIYVYSGDDKPTSGISGSKNSIVDMKIYKLSKKAIQDISEKELDEDAKMDLVERVYNRNSLEDADYVKKMRRAIFDINHIQEYELKKNEKRLRDIQTQTIIPKVVYDSDDGKLAIKNALEQISKSKESLSKVKKSYEKQKFYVEMQKAKYEIKDYSVDVPSYIFEMAQKKGKIYDYVELDSYNQIPIVDLDYSYEQGLSTVIKEKEFDETLQFM